MIKIGIYPGTFDPLTFGHIDLIKRSLKIVDKLIIGLADNNNKKPLLSINDRKSIVQKDLKQFANNDQISIKVINGLLTDFAKLNNVTCIIRGLRAVSDFENEFQMSLMNKNLDHNIDTIFLMPDEKYTYISSSIVKEVASLGGDIKDYVPSSVLKALDKKYG